MVSEYVPPTYRVDAFHCPYCDVYCHQNWSGYGNSEPELDFSGCFRCGKRAVWVEGHLIFPPTRTAPPPHVDLPNPSLDVYEEARSIADQSPRAAAALLRLCMQQLVATLGSSSTNLNQAVHELVLMGLSVQIQQAMDTVRLIGNEAVHPGSIDVNDDPQMVQLLFELVNLVVESMITQPKKISELYQRLPQTKLDEIVRRDGLANP